MLNESSSQATTAPVVALTISTGGEQATNESAMPDKNEDGTR